MSSSVTQFLCQPVNKLTGIGTQSALKLTRLGINQVQDLLFHLPLRYEDRTRIYTISSLRHEMRVLICGKIEFTEVTQGARPTLICRVSDPTGEINLRFFHFNPRQLQQFTPGSYMSCFGEVRFSYLGLEIAHPEYQIIRSPEHCQTETCLTPVYPLTEGLHQGTLRKAIQQALKHCILNPEILLDWLPATILKRLDYPELLIALQALHSPDAKLTAEIMEQGALPALQRLAFEELTAHYLSLQNAKLLARDKTAPAFASNASTIEHFLKSLPFTLTNAQQRVIQDITHDCSENRPMLRLIQGDVGSGKTVVAAFAALLALSSGYQVAIMAPTELLAEQHLRNFQLWFQNFDIQIQFLTGHIKGKQRTEALEALANGTAGIAIGTHALFQEGVHFKQLGLIVIDEQHRFGVHQRMALRNKAQQTGISPHQLVMTATPIPRTLAMLNYSDLDISIIDELPPGRKPIQTSILPSERRPEVIQRIQSWVDQKRQVYWVCTLIEESEILECETAEKTAAFLTTALPEVRIGLIHGRMKTVDKDAIMHSFKQQTIDLLVATTVIEVGVDVRNANLMIIENPERLGLSQLHQLRGRIGRGDAASFCLLMYQAPLSQTAKQRLGILRDTQDGFIIAEKDLQLRGPGEIMGTRQTGQMQFKIADLNRDSHLLETVKETAEQMLTHYPEAITPLIQRWVGHASHYSEV